MIPTYVINLKRRIDRKTHIIGEFRNRSEFNVQIVEAFEHETGTVGLWATITSIIQKAIHQNLDYVIICEDDHVFTEHYSKKRLLQMIVEAGNLKADILCGGISWVSGCLPVSENFLWIEKFSGLQFTIVFKQFFHCIIEASFSLGDAADYKISSLSTSKYLIFPFLSTQKDFGYSDVTSINNGQRSVKKLFDDTSSNITIVKDVFSFYNDRTKAINLHLSTNDTEDWTIPTYIICQSDSTHERSEIKKEFEGRYEFETTFIKLPEHHNPNVSLWLSVLNVIQLAIDNKDDVIIICRDYHQFTDNYSKEALICGIIKAHQYDAEILCGGIADFGMSVPVTKNQLWISSFCNSPFLVIYKSVFQNIIREDYNDDVIPEHIFSTIAKNKMTFLPFISHDKRMHTYNPALDYADLNTLSINPFKTAEKRLQSILAVSHYRLKCNQPNA